MVERTSTGGAEPACGTGAPAADLKLLWFSTWGINLGPLVMRLRLPEQFNVFGCNGDSFCDLRADHGDGLYPLIDHGPKPSLP